MAFDPTILSYTLQDELGVQATSIAYISFDGATNPVDTLIAAWVTYGGLLDACTGAKIVGGHVKIPLPPDGSWKSTPTAGYAVEMGELNNFSAVDSTKRFGILIPAFLRTLIVSGKPNTASGALHALLMEILTPSTTGITSYDNALGEALTTFRDAFLNTRKHRKQLERESTITTD